VYPADQRHYTCAHVLPMNNYPVLCLNKEYWYAARQYHPILKGFRDRAPLRPVRLHCEASNAWLSPPLGEGYLCAGGVAVASWTANRLECFGIGHHKTLCHKW
jgi:hypothetical protein